MNLCVNSSVIKLIVERQPHPQLSFHRSPLILFLFHFFTIAQTLTECDQRAVFCVFLLTACVWYLQCTPWAWGHSCRQSLSAPNLHICMQFKENGSVTHQTNLLKALVGLIGQTVGKCDAAKRGTWLFNSNIYLHELMCLHIVFSLYNVWSVRRNMIPTDSFSCWVFPCFWTQVSQVIMLNSFQNNSILRRQHAKSMQIYANKMSRVSH